MKKLLLVIAFPAAHLLAEWQNAMALHCVEGLQVHVTGWRKKQ